MVSQKALFWSSYWKRKEKVSFSKQLQESKIFEKEVPFVGTL